MTRLRIVFILTQVILQACSSTPQPEPPAAVAIQPPAFVNLEIKSAADINPDAGGIGSPVILRIYELRETTGFNSADFFSLFNNDQAALSGESVSKQELLIKPNDSKTMSIQVAPETKALGFFVAFRQLDTSQWRAIMPITAHQTVSAQINLRGNELVFKSAGAAH